MHTNIISSNKLLIHSATVQEEVVACKQIKLPDVILSNYKTPNRNIAILQPNA